MLNTKDKLSALCQAIRDQRWGHAVMMAKSNPEDAKSQVLFSMDHNEFKIRVLPLHWACMMNPDQDIIDTLLQCYPHSIKMTDSKFYFLPIHFACLKSAKEDIVRMLLIAYPDGACTLGANGRLPIHHACTNGTSPAVIKTLLEFNPMGSRAVDKFGMLPIHLACLQNAPVEVIRVLLLACPASVYFKTNNGNTPISCAKQIGNCENKKAIVSLLGTSKRSRNKCDARASDKFLCDELIAQPQHAIELGEFC